MNLIMPWQNICVEKVSYIIGIIGVCAFYAFLIVYFIKINSNCWNIRAATQYFLLVAIPVVNILLSLCLIWYLAVPIVIIDTIIFLLNNKNIIHGLKHFDEQGISAVLPKFQERQKLEWKSMTPEQRVNWREENTVNPMKFKNISCIIISIIPFLVGFFFAFLISGD